MEVDQCYSGENERKLIKDCSVMVFRLVDDIVKSRTIRVLPVDQLESCNSNFSKSVLPPDTTIPNARPITDQKRTIKKVSPLSVYSKVNDDIITEICCKRYRKRKLQTQNEPTEDVREIVENVVRHLVDQVSVEPIENFDEINCSSPGEKENQLVYKFCRDNDFAEYDYNDLKELFTFRTLPADGAKTAIYSIPLPRTKRKQTLKVNRKTVTKSKIINTTTRMENDVSSNPQRVDLQKIENVKIRKILEDFERLSRSQNMVKANKYINTNSETEVPSNKNSTITTTPLNLCKKDNSSQKNEITKKDQSCQSDSRSILRTLLHPQVENKMNSSQKSPVIREVKQNGSHQEVTKKSTGQQTDIEEFKTIDRGECANREQHKQKNIQSNYNRFELQYKSKWINDPKAILKKIQKLKRDIIYLDLLAEEKEKERIAIICFKNYKENILKNIFASEMPEEVARTENSVNLVNSVTTPVTTPKLAHSVGMPTANGKALFYNGPLNLTVPSLYPSTISSAEANSSYQCVNGNRAKNSSEFSKKEENNYSSSGKCLKCGFAKNNYFCSMCDSHLHRNLHQDRSWVQHAK